MLKSVRRFLAPFFVAWLFLTRLPLPSRLCRWAGTEETAFFRSVPFFPWVGLVLGGLIWAADPVLRWAFSPLLSALLLIALLVVLTGGLHLDGWMDTADGLLSGRERERVLAIMKDSRVGAFGVLAVVLLLLLKWGGLAELGADRGPLLLLMPVAGRMAMTGCVLFWPDARSGEGIGSLFHQPDGGGKKFGRQRLWGGWVSMFAVSLIILALTGVWGWLTLWAAVACGWFMAARIARRLGGLTGDVYGAVNEAAEVAAVYLYVPMTFMAAFWA